MFVLWNIRGVFDACGESCEKNVAARNPKHGIYGATLVGNDYQLAQRPLGTEGIRPGKGGGTASLLKEENGRFGGRDRQVTKKKYEEDFRGPLREGDS